MSAGAEPHPPSSSPLSLSTLSQAREPVLSIEGFEPGPCTPEAWGTLDVSLFPFITLSSHAEQDSDTHTHSVNSSKAYLITSTADSALWVRQVDLQTKSSKQSPTSLG